MTDPIWNTVTVVAVVALIAATIPTLVGFGPGALAVVRTTGLSTVVYLFGAGVNGHDSFVVRVIVALALSGVMELALSLVRPPRSGSERAWKVVAVPVGAALPPLVVFIWLLSVCSGGGCFD